MSELFDSDFLKKIQQFAIASRVVLADGAGGNRKSRSKGSSVEFSDYREYTSGDDFRRVDWNAYGRFEKLFIKLFMEEREAPVHIFLDTSKSMDWGEPNKSVASRRLAAALGYISLANYDRLSLLCINDRTAKSRVSLRGKNVFAEVLDFLENVQYSGNTDLYKAISDSRMKGNRGISVIISDLLPPAGLDEAIKYLQYRKQDVHVCHILAPQETAPELEENSRLLDTESGSFMDVTASPLLIKTYKKVYEAFIAEVRECCFRRGASYAGLQSSMPVEILVKRAIEGAGMP